MKSSFQILAAKVLELSIYYTILAGKEGIGH